MGISLYIATKVHYMSKAKTNVYWVVNVLLVVLQQETQCLLLCRDFNQQQQPMQSDINNIGNSGANLHINDVSIQPLKVTFFDSLRQNSRAFSLIFFIKLLITATTPTEINLILSITLQHLDTQSFSMTLSHFSHVFNAVTTNYTLN